MKKYPPFVNAYKKIPELFNEIKKASVPAKFTYDFLNTILGLKSSSFRAMIPLLKSLGFLDQSNVPTQTYKEYRDDDQSKFVLADKIREAYGDIFQANEFAYELNKKDLTAKLKNILGVSEDDKNLPNVAGTFIELVKLADFKKQGKKNKENTLKKEDVAKIEEELVEKPRKTQSDSKLGIAYNINLNLPATTEIEVFNSIFKSLKEHILNQE